MTAPTNPKARSRVSAVVFDVGNVLIEWDPRHLYRRLFDGRADAMEWFLANICTAAWNLEQDAGRSWADAVGTLAAAYPEWRAEIEAYDRDWHAMIPRVIEGSVAILAGLREAGVPLYAITNFSREKYAESLGRFPFLDWFDGVVVSAHERLLKPDRPIFDLLCRRFGLQADRCLFIDDNAANVAGAEAAGLQATLFSTPERLRATLQAAGLPV